MHIAINRDTIYRIYGPMKPEEVISIFREYCRIALYMREQNIKLRNVKETITEDDDIIVNNIEILVKHSKMCDKFVIREFNDEPKYSKDEIRLEVLRRMPKEYVEYVFVKKVSDINIGELYERIKRSNSDDIKNKIKEFSRCFFGKWVRIRNAKETNVLEMVDEYQEFMKSVDIIYLDVEFYDRNMGIIEDFIRGAQYNNLNEFRMKYDSVLIDYIYDGDVKNVSKYLSMNDVGDIDVYYKFAHYMKNKDLIEIFVLYGADPEAEVIKNGHIIYGL